MSARTAVGGRSGRLSVRMPSAHGIALLAQARLEISNTLDSTFPELQQNEDVTRI